MSRWRSITVWAGLALIIGSLNLLVARKEWLWRNGQPVLLELAPRDPRSLMQGDYMELDYAVERDLFDGNRAGDARDGAIVVKLDQRGVAALERLAQLPETLAPDERLLRFRRRYGRLRVGPDAFFFEEGQADRFARARYGELRVDADGNGLLIGLRDAEGRPLP